MLEIDGSVIWLDLKLDYKF